MENKKITEITEIAKAWILEAAEMAKQAIATGFEVDSKVNRHDLVTNVDRAIETFFINNVKKTFPDHRLLGEEGQGEAVNDLKGIVWILDPIDGTINFVVKKRDFAITLGIYEEGVGIIGFVYDVMRDQMYCGIRNQGATLNGKPLPPIDPDLEVKDTLVITEYIDIKSFPKLSAIVEESHGMRFHGVAAIEFMEVATSRAGAFIHIYLKPWDIGGGKIIVEELGGKVTRMDGSTINMIEKGTVLVAAPKIHKAVLAKCFNHPATE